MNTKLSFYDWFFQESAARPGAKSELYPLGYGGIGLYPTSYFIASAADAVTYMSQDERLYKTNKTSHPK